MKGFTVERTPGEIRGGEVGKERYARLKVCRLCTLTKLVPEEDDVCGDCWALRMVGFASVSCPFFLFERKSPLFPAGRVPIETCYDCSFRKGWTERLEPVCGHPAAAIIVERRGVELVQCPEQSQKGAGSRLVPAHDCKACLWFRGELVSRGGRFAYCSYPRPNRIRRRAPEAVDLFGA